MDAVSLETPQVREWSINKEIFTDFNEFDKENEFIKQRIARGGNIRFIWTSGRKCNFAGCDRPGI